MVDGIKQYLKHPEWRKQHKWRKAIWTTMSRMGLTGVHALPLNRRWVEIHRRKMPLEGLDPAFEGKRLVQLSDLHYSPVVWQRYLVQYLRWVNDLEPDWVVITGDLITGGYRFAHRIATILSHLKPAHGVICTFGNHDYSIYGKGQPVEGARRADYLEKCLLDRGMIVLRNEAMKLELPGARKPVTLVGLDDEWSGAIDAEEAFKGICDDHPIICLNHNPANVKELMEYPWQWMLSGHTHGRQVATSKFGKRFYPHRYRHYTHGYYAVQGRHLYVNRGLSYGQRVLDWCRPEVTVFKFQQAIPTNDASSSS
ncbi:MAG TPA: metallophosphoesterase [Tepidisphaeraceae bacterium]|nr:metallophosphoesterase [Tepidisphaeraceae bacterium]